MGGRRRPCTDNGKPLLFAPPSQPPNWLRTRNSGVGVHEVGRMCLDDRLSSRTIPLGRSQATRAKAHASSSTDPDASTRTGHTEVLNPHPPTCKPKQPNWARFRSYYFWKTGTEKFRPSVKKSSHGSVPNSPYLQFPRPNCSIRRSKRQFAHTVNVLEPTVPRVDKTPRFSPPLQHPVLARRFR